MIFEAQDVLIGDQKQVLLCDFLQFGHGSVPTSITERQLAMRAFVAATDVQGVRVKTSLPVQQWQSKLRPFPYATNGLIFVERRECARPHKLEWMVRRSDFGV